MWTIFETIHTWVVLFITVRQHTSIQRWVKEHDFIKLKVRLIIFKLHCYRSDEVGTCTFAYTHEVFWINTIILRMFNNPQCSLVAIFQSSRKLVFRRKSISHREDFTTESFRQFSRRQLNRIERTATPSSTVIENNCPSRS